MGGPLNIGSKPRRRRVADVAVVPTLTPEPTLHRFEDVERFTKQQLARHRRRRIRPAEHRHRCRPALKRHALRIPCGLHLGRKALVGEIASDRVQPGIKVEGDHVPQVRGRYADARTISSPNSDK